MLQRLKKFSDAFGRKQSLSLRLLRYFVFLIILMLMLSVFTIQYSYSLTKKNNQILKNLETIQTLLNSIESFPEEISNYKINPIEEYRERFNNLHKNATTCTEKLREQFPDSYIWRDMEAMLESYYTDADSWFERFDKTKPLYLFQKELISLENIRTYMITCIYQGMSVELDRAQSESISAASAMRKSYFLLYIMVVIMTVFCIFSAGRISRRVTRPIRMLSLQCIAVADGDLNIQCPKIQQNDEINILIDSFNTMVTSLRQSQEAMEEKHFLEQQLKEELLKNIEMENLLNRSELEFLLMQVNPHFLYNTLNTISGMALSENAGKTRKMIDALSVLMRNNLSISEEIVPLSTELDTIQNYLYIQKIRFQDRISFDIQCEPECMKCRLPAMILQPLIENAIIHGLEEKMAPGLLRITVQKKECLFIQIYDNGVGVSPDILKKLSEQSTAETSIQHRGIGISNVRRRLTLIYGRDILEIESMLNEGTTITIRIPYQDTVGRG